MVTETYDLQQVELCLITLSSISAVYSIKFFNMLSMINKARAQYIEHIFSENFKVFVADGGFLPKAYVAYCPETKCKVKVTVKLMNWIKVYSGDINSFDDIGHITSELSREINFTICQAVGQKSFDLLKLEQPYPIKTNLDILIGYFTDNFSIQVDTESMISYEGKSYVPHKYKVKRFMLPLQVKALILSLTTALCVIGNRQ